MLSEKDALRFWGKVALPSPETGCMEWLASKNDEGYGSLSVGGRLYKAHRISHELRVGPIPEKYEVDHLCRNHSCVRPDHLEAVTKQENMRRGESGKYLRERTHCPQGHEYNEENTRITKQGWRKCRACAREQMRRKREEARGVIRAA